MAWNAEANEVFLKALESISRDERGAYLEQRCGGNAELRSQVQSLLEASERAGSFLETPVVQHDSAALESQSCAGATPGETHTAADDSSLDFLAASEKPGSVGRLGHYEILETIGRGGMGVVLKAFDEQLHRNVAIKVMAPQLATNALARKRFVREARAAAAVRNEHVVNIHAVEEANELPYLAMEYIAGVSLQERLDKNGPLQLAEILRIGMQTAAGLAAAHAQGLIHRDIKPSNILLENGVERVKITDFGLARAVDDVSLTQSGVIAGTPQYMSPEQARGETVDHRTDLFSLGSVLYAMCTGRAPFRATGSMAVLKRVCEDTPRAIREVNPETPDWLSAIIAKLQAKNPADRFQSAAEVAELLSRHLAHVQQPSVVGQVANLSVECPAGRQTAPHRRRLALASAVLLCLVAVLAVTEATGVSNLRATVIGIFTPEGTLVREVGSPEPEGEIRRFVGHTGGGIYRVAFSPDGCRALSGGSDAMLKLWDVSTGKELRRFIGHAKTIHDLAFLPDGRRALSVSTDQTMFLWDLDTATELRRYEGHAGPIHALAVSPNGRCALTGSADSTLRLWDVATGKELIRLEGHTGHVFGAVIRPDGKSALSAGADRILRLWDLDSGKPIRLFEGHQQEVYCLAISPDGRWALSGSKDKTRRLWDVETGREVRSYPGHNARVRSIAFSPDGCWGLSTSNDSSVCVWNLETGQELRQLKGHEGWVRDAVFSPDGHYVLSGGRDCVLRLWKLPPLSRGSDKSN